LRVASGEQSVHSEQVARGPEPRDLPHGGRRDDRVASEFLAPVDVRQMNLDDGHRHGCNGVTERNRVMGERAGIDHDPAEPLRTRGLHPADELAFMVGLTTHDPNAARRRMPLDGPIDLRQRGAAVHRGLPGPQQIQVRAMKHENGASRASCHRSDRIHGHAGGGNTASGTAAWSSRPPIRPGPELGSGRPLMSGKRTGHRGPHL
jgi:hypothetical protein